MKFCYIKEGYGGMLRIGLGNKVYYKNPALEGKFHGEWEIISRSVAWRVMRNSELICASGDDGESSNDNLKLLRKESLANITQDFFSDVHITFTGNLQIQYFSDSIEEPKIEILGPSETTYELTSDGWERIETNEVRDKLNKLDKVLIAYSEECSERWSKVLPHKDTENHCDDCFYFRNIDGHFSFLDFGICSNKNSENDASLVNVNSGCRCHRRLSELID